MSCHLRVPPPPRFLWYQSWDAVGTVVIETVLFSGQEWKIWEWFGGLRERDRKRERAREWVEKRRETTRLHNTHQFITGEKGPASNDHAEYLHVKNDELRTWACCSTRNRRRIEETMLMKEINRTYILGYSGSLSAKVLLQSVRHARMLPSAGLSSTPHLYASLMTSGKKSTQYTIW